MPPSSAEVQELREKALMRAARRGVPFVHRSGRYVTLVLRWTTRTVKSIGGTARSSLQGHVQCVECSSSGLAAAVARRALTDLQVFPELADQILRVSLRYEEAAVRFAHRQRRVAYRHDDEAR